jgi:sulfide dehydrogenase [flavocytochrome c] flavoprotein chain
MFTRRSFLQVATGGLTASMLTRPALAKSRAHVVVVGGGFGGATCAKYLRRLDKTLAVTLVTPEPRFLACPFSNAVVVGLQELSALRATYDVLRRRYGVRVIYAQAIDLDPVAHQVRLNNGTSLTYDRLVLAPGVEFQWNALTGYDEAASRIFPHAWEAGTQTTLLRRQLAAMDDGGLVVITVPDNPYRCPPGPYERASLIAHYLKAHKPRSKILILDAKDVFTKHELFRAAWVRLYPGLLEWVSGSQGGRATQVDITARAIRTDFDEYKPAVANIIPPQQAAAIARIAGLDDGKGWCPIHASTFESTVQQDVHIIGDAAIANPMPKSAFAANVQAKACATAIVSLLRGQAVAPPVLMNTCYSLVAPDYGISITGVYRAVNDEIKTVPGSDGMSPLDASDEMRAREAAYARSWYANIMADSFT